jgi:hypothetical protein
MITAQIRAEQGKVVREVARGGNRVEVTVEDDAGRSVEVILNQHGQLRIVVSHHGQEPAMWKFTPEGFYDLDSHHDSQRPRAPIVAPVPGEPGFDFR